MFQPRYFKQSDKQSMLEFIKHYPMASLVTLSSQGLVGNHIPMLVIERDGNYTLQGHVARVNSLWQDLDDSVDALALFHGPNSYVSPNWYPSKRTNPKTVPTWNYVAVHVTGKIEFFDDKTWLKEHLTHLSQVHEQKVGESWQLTDAPEDYINTMLKAIVGVEIAIKEIKGNTKMSQNHSKQNRDGVVKGFRAMDNTDAASWVENPNKFGKE